MSPGWIGFDLDGTLAQHLRNGSGPYEIGPPVPAMVAHVRRLLDKGYEVRIVTARVASDVAGRHDQWQQVRHWVRQYIGTPLRVVSEKDPDMWALFDDRAVAVERNTGRLLSPCPPELA